MRAVSAHGFAGGFDLGVVQAGWELVGKVEGPSGFGHELVEANRKLLGGDTWEHVNLEPVDWPVFEAEMVYGNPACSGFSALSVYQRGPSGVWGDGRGVDSHLNQGMYEVIDYASRVKPEVVAFESVEAAGTKGRSLMQKLRQRLEDQSGLKYNLTHVYQDNASIGGASLRRRYHFVAHRFPLIGMDRPVVDHVPTLAETIGDLADKPLDWEGKPDGHMIVDIPGTRDVARIAQMAEDSGEPWAPREKIGRVVCRLGSEPECAECVTLKEAGEPPKHGFAGNDMSWVRNAHRKTNLYAVIRWRGDDPARVVTGVFNESAVHPWLNRTMTFREAARIQGFPDTWTMLPARGANCTCDFDKGRAPHPPHGAVLGKGAAGWLGKGIPVPAGRWIGEGIARSLAGDPGPVLAYDIGPREFEINLIGAYKSRQITMFG